MDMRTKRKISLLSEGTVSFPGFYMAGPILTPFLEECSNIRKLVQNGYSVKIYSFDCSESQLLTTANCNELINRYESAGDDVVSSDKDGLMSFEDKRKLNEIANEADDIEVASYFQNGVKVATISINGEENDIWAPNCEFENVDLSNYTTNAQLQEALKNSNIEYSNTGVKQAVGGVRAGTVFNKAKITDVLDMIFAPPYAKPTISIGLSCRNLYDKNGVDIPTSVTVTANVTKNTKNVTYVSAYCNNTLIETKTTDVASGGTFRFTYTMPSTPVDCTFKVECSDGESTSSTTSKVVFFALSYQGTIADGVEINETSIKTLTSVLKSKVAGTYTFNTSYGRFVHAIPKAVGSISSVKDLVNNFTYTESCTTVSMTINNEDYWVCYLTDPMGFDNVSITYA